jgi:tetratricopeptide (TPR) repeat protein
MTPQDAQKVVKRLAAAEGYLELTLPAQALGELEGIETDGPFEAIAQLFRGEALQAVSRFEEAIPAFNRAAELFPAPFNQRALLGLSRCYRERGETALADEAEAAATPPDLPPGTRLQLAILPIFQIEDNSSRRRSHQAPPKG